jgi:hypothetical protein
MDHYSILDLSSSSPEGEADTGGASGTATSSISAKIAAANQLLPNPLESAPRSPGEDAGRSLAEMAHRDLDAALQLLAERAQYITGASGTAIALRRGEHNDMVCRAAAGSSAPDLGALLSMEHGLSGECVRTRQLLRCDDAERDPRVNREVCRELGIASVIVMPIVGDEQVLGIFELLSSKPRAFDERDLSALLRLSEMVETAVRHPFPAQTAPHIHEVVVAGSQPQLENVAERPKAAPRPEPLTVAAVSSDPCPVLPPPAVLRQETPPANEIAEAPAEKKVLFWSAAVRAQGSEPPKPNAETSAVPPVLRNFKKCQTCGFPISQGRILCVECEEKQWRGQRIAQATPPQVPVPQQPNQLQSLVPAPPATDRSVEEEILVQDSQPDQLSIPLAVNSELAVPAFESEATKIPQEAKPVASSEVETIIAPQTLAAASLPSSSDVGAGARADVLSSNDAAPFLSSALQSESWFASNKYVLAALLVVAIVIGAIAWLR